MYDTRPMLPRTDQLVRDLHPKLRDSGAIQFVSEPLNASSENMILGMGAGESLNTSSEIFHLPKVSCDPAYPENFV